MLLFFLVSVLCVRGEPEVLFEWQELAFAGVPRSSYNVSNCCVTGVKADLNGTLYVSVPRWLPGVPATLCTVRADGLLEPFPSLAANGLQGGWLTYVQSMEIDARGWMWILDVGRQNIYGGPVVNGQPKLVIYDLNAGCIVQHHGFAKDVLSWNNSFANDLVVDEENGLAYITDTWAAGGMVVYRLSDNSARRWDDATFAGNPEGKITINGKTYSNDSPVDGIALSPDRQWIYYSSVSEPYLYRASTSQLSNFSDPGPLRSQLLGKKGFSDGLAFDLDGNLYYGAMEHTAVMKWNASLPLSEAEVLYANATTNQWADTFGFSRKSLLWSTNRLLRFFSGELSSTDANFRIFKQDIDSRSYIFSGNPVPPSLPCQ